MGNGGLINWFLAVLPGGLGVVLRVLVGLLGIGTVAGCVQGGPKNIEEQKQTAQVYTDFIHENGGEGVVQLGYNGRTGVYQEASLGVGTGLTTQATVIVRPQGQVPTTVVGPPAPTAPSTSGK